MKLVAKVVGGMLLLACSCALSAEEWKSLFNGRNLDGWQVQGESVWTVMKDGTLVGQRTHPLGDPFQTWPLTKEQYHKWLNQQSWLYTVKDFDQYDLHVEYWIPAGGNSGVSIRDTSRGRYSFGPEDDGRPTPSHIGYEIQILAEEKAKYPTGSVYLFTPAKTGMQKADDWNTMEIESRHDMIRVRLNGQVVAESPGDPSRPKAGPIGLQLHDRFSWVLFRNIKIKVVD